MAYRIKQIGQTFYPQTRLFLFFWCNFIEDNGDAVSRDSLQAAKDFLTVDHVQRKLRQKEVFHKFKIWEK